MVQKFKAGHRDPSAYVDGYNLYRYARSSPAVGRDPNGLWTSAQCWDRYMACERAAQDEYNACIRDGWSPEFCDISFAARSLRCAASYAACMGTRGVECCFATAADALAWARQNPGKVVIGATVCVGGTLFIWGTGGAGAPILIAL